MTKPDASVTGVCWAAKAVQSVLEADRRGGLPNFTAYHVVQALKLYSASPIGRPKLQKLLGLGEASTKTLIARLREEGLIEFKGRGSRATRLGAKIAGEISKHLRFGVIGFDINYWKEQAAYVSLECAQPPRSLTDVYRVRDYLVVEGCRESIIGGVSVKPRFPGVPKAIENYIASVVDELDVKGLVVIVPATCIQNAVSAIIRLIAETCPC